MKKFNLTALALFGALAPTSAQAQLVVVVNNANTEKIDSTAFQNLYLGKTKSFPSGAKAVPLMLEPGAPALEDFLQGSIGKNTSQYRAFWARLMFSGSGTPPQNMKSSQDVVDLVARNPDTIGVADAAVAKGKVRIIELK